MGKLGLNFQPRAVWAHAFVASGSALANSVCVIHPHRPCVGSWRRSALRDLDLGTALRAVFFAAGRVDLELLLDLRADFLAMLISAGGAGTAAIAPSPLKAMAGGPRCRKGQSLVPLAMRS